RIKPSPCSANARTSTPRRLAAASTTSTSAIAASLNSGSRRAWAWTSDDIPPACRPGRQPVKTSPAQPPCAARAAVSARRPVRRNSKTRPATRLLTRALLLRRGVELRDVLFGRLAEILLATLAAEDHEPVRLPRHAVDELRVFAGRP